MYCICRLPFPQAIACDDAEGLIFLGDANGPASKLVAIDEGTYAVRWESAPRSLNVCGGIAALPTLKLVAVSGTCDNRVFFKRSTDGESVAYLPCKVWAR